MTTGRRCAAPPTATSADFTQAVPARRFFARSLAAAVCAVLISTSTLRAAAPGEATSDRSAKAEAMRAIPWNQLSPQARNTVGFVTKNASIYRRLPTRVIDCDPELFTFLVQHPEVVVDVWRVMGISRVALERGPGGVYRGTDGAGTTGSVRFLFADWRPGAQNTALVYANGAYEGQPFMSTVRAQSVMLLRSGAIQESNGRHYVTVQVDTFVQVEQVGLDLLAKTVQPWITKMADQNFVDTLGFVSTFSQTAEQNPQGVQRLATRLTSVDGPTRNELVHLCYQSAGRYAQIHSP
jgi:hypothetical protein